MRDLLRHAGKWLLIGLLLVAVSVQAFEHENSFDLSDVDALDNSAMELLESDFEAAPAMVEMEQEIEQPDNVLEQQEEEAVVEEEELPVGDLDASPALLEVSSETGSQWINARRHRHRRGHSIRAEREALAQQMRENAIYAENLRKLAWRREHWHAPKGSALPKALNRATTHLAKKAGTKRDADGFMTNEEAQVESLIQMETKPMLHVDHVNNVHAKLDLDTLRGTGLSNSANRAATEAGLQANPLNHPPAPAFVPLAAPAAPAATSSDPIDLSSFVERGSESRPAYAGPRTADLPAMDVPSPKVLQQHAQSNPVSEREFVKGLPPAFMELDAATQLQILALADSNVDVDAESESESESHVEAQAEHEAHIETETETESESEAEAEADESTSVDESDLASAASPLNTLAALQKESHVPFAKLIKLLAKGNKQ